MFIDDIITLLSASGVGVSGETLFWTSGAELPAGDGPFLNLQETGGTAPIIMHNSDTVPAYQRPSAQLVARGGDADSARLMIKNAYTALVQKRNLIINGTWYVKIDVKQEPFDLGTDEAGRVRYAFNIDAVKRPS